MIPPDVRRQIEALRKAANERCRTADSESEVLFESGRADGLATALRILEAHDEQARRDRAADFAERVEDASGQRCAETAWALRETRDTL